jgi:hypothetical protein
MMTTMPQYLSKWKPRPDQVKPVESIDHVRPDKEGDSKNARGTSSTKSDFAKELTKAIKNGERYD